MGGIFMMPLNGLHRCMCRGAPMLLHHGANVILYISNMITVLTSFQVYRSKYTKVLDYPQAEGIATGYYVCIY